MAAALSVALTHLDAEPGDRLSWTQRALSRHPSLDRRVEALHAEAAAANRI